MKKIFSFVMFVFILLFFTSCDIGTDSNLTNSNKPDITAGNTSSINRKYGNTNGNLISDMFKAGGIAALNNGWEYYAATGGDNSNKAALYKTNGTEKIKLSDDWPLCINVIDDWVYYINSFNGYPYKININGTDKIKICDDMARPIYVVDDWIYYTNESDNCFFYKIKTDGTERTKLIDNEIINISIEDDWIYFLKKLRTDEISDHEPTYELKGTPIYKIKTDGTGYEKAYENLVTYYVIQDNWVYFSNVFESDNKIYKMKIDGTELTAIYSIKASLINVDGDWVYYVDFDNGNLCKVKTDGTENTILISKRFPQKINIVGDWIYFSDRLDSCYFKVKTDGTLEQEVN